MLTLVVYVWREWVNVGGDEGGWGQICSILPQYHMICRGNRVKKYRMVTGNACPQCVGHVGGQ